MGGRRGGGKGGSGGGGGKGGGDPGGDAGGDGGGVNVCCLYPLHLQQAISGVTSTPYSRSKELHGVFSHRMLRVLSSVKKKSASLQGEPGGGLGLGGGKGGLGEGGGEGGGGGGGGGRGGLGGGLGSCENA